MKKDLRTLRQLDDVKKKHLYHFSRTPRGLFIIQILYIISLYYYNRVRDSRGGLFNFFFTFSFFAFHSMRKNKEKKCGHPKSRIAE